MGAPARAAMFFAAPVAVAVISWAVAGGVAWQLPAVVLTGVIGGVAMYLLIPRPSDPGQSQKAKQP